MNRTLSTLWIALALLAPAAGARAENGDPVIAHERYTLPNGLEVILHPDRSVPLVAVNVWYHVGSGDETPGKSGFAHLFEHMMFQGSVHTGEDAHFQILEKIGASGVNGTTSADRTNYYEVVPSHQIETALWLESDRMGYMLPLLNEKSLENQRLVVRNERRQSYDNRPYGAEVFKLNELLYPEGHPHRYLVIGRHEDLDGASADDVRGFFRKWYVPANATLAVAGDFESAEAKQLIEKWFGSFPKSSKPARSDTPAVLAKTERATVNDSFAKLRRIRYAWPSPAYYAPGDAELDIAASALANPGTGRLYQILVHEKQLAQSVAATQSSGRLSTFQVIVDLKSDADMAAVEKIVQDELARIAREPVSQRELQRTVVAVESSFIFGLEDLLTRTQLLQGYNHFLGDSNQISFDLDRYRKATAEQVQKVAAAVLGAPHVEVITMPAAAGAAPSAEGK